MFEVIQGLASAPTDSSGDLLPISVRFVALQAEKGITLRNTNSIDFLTRHFSAANNSLIKTKHQTATNVLT